MPDRWEPPSAAAAALIAATAAAILEAPEPFLVAVDTAVLGAAGALAADPDIAAETRASDRANVLRWLTANAARPGAAVGPDLAPEALEIGRDVVRRGIDRQILQTAYRHGQNTALRGFMRRMAALAEDADVLAEALDVAARSLFAFVDDVLAGLDGQIEREREELLGGHLAQRREAAQLVLQGAPIPEARASTRLGYDLAGGHLAAVLWGEDQGELERVAERLARAAGAPRALTLPAGATTLWAWMSTTATPEVDRLTEALIEGVRVAVGSPQRGMVGFRSSHQDALEVRRLVGRHPAAPALTTYADVEVAVLASADPDRARQFVAATLGPLLGEREALRETLRIHLQEQGSATRVAERVFAHRNTVLKRVARAEALLPQPWRERPLAVALALELDHWLGAEHT
ncbi:MAG: hypothetical protein QOF76_3875 [Solirubrobacteraceae bacterium]|jgi:DNA-binding PucR family transcriptional regulator|nr:hypothetical protein [Solirubrobacteraceae bacterium]